jgi:hypothetical protein
MILQYKIETSNRTSIVAHCSTVNEHLRARSVLPCEAVNTPFHLGYIVLKIRAVYLKTARPLQRES